MQYQASYWFSHGAILIILLISTRCHIKHYTDFYTMPYQSLCYKTPALLKPYCNIDLYILHPDAEKANGESSWRAILLPAEICWVNTHKPGCIFLEKKKENLTSFGVCQHKTDVNWEVEPGTALWEFLTLGLFTCTGNWRYSQNWSQFGQSIIFSLFLLSRREPEFFSFNLVLWAQNSNQKQ